MRMLSTPLASQPGMFRTSLLGRWTFFAGDAYLSISRDVPDCHYQQFVQQLDACATMQGLPGAGQGLTSHHQAAVALTDAFRMMASDSSWFVAELSYAGAPLSDRLEQLGDSQMLASQDYAAFSQVSRRHC